MKRTRPGHETEAERFTCKTELCFKIFTGIIKKNSVTVYWLHWAESTIPDKPMNLLLGVNGGGRFDFSKEFLNEDDTPKTSCSSFNELVNSRIK